MRSILLTAALVITSCSRPIPETDGGSTRVGAVGASAVPIAYPMTDGSAVHGTGHIPDRDTRRAMRARTEAAFAAMGGMGGTPMVPADAGPPPTRDKRVDGCVAKRFATWAQLKACMDGLAEQPDGGHKLGAVRPPSVNPALSISAWAYGPAGLDSNTGADCAHAVQHDYEIVARLGGTTSPPWPQSTTITTCGAPADNTDKVIWTPPFFTGVLNTFTATPTVIATGTLGTITPKINVAGMGTPDAMEANLGGLGAVDNKVVNTTRSSYAWINKMAGAVAQMTQPVLLSDDTTEDNGWTAGDSISVQSMIPANISQIGMTVKNVDLSNSFGVNSTIMALGTLRGSLVHTFLQGTFSSVGSRLKATFVSTGIGSLFSGSMVGGTFCGFWGGDIIINNNLTLTQCPMYNGGGNVGNEFFDGAFLDPSGFVNNGARIFFHGYVFGLPTAIVYGNGSGPGLDTGNAVYADADSCWEYYEPATRAFVGPHMNLNLDWGQESEDAWGIATDYSHDIVQSYARKLTVAALSLPIGGPTGIGFADQAINPFLQNTFVGANAQAFVPGRPDAGALITDTAHGGVGLDAGCPDGSLYEGLGASSNMAQCGPSGCPVGQFLGGAGLTCGTPTGTGPTCPIASSCLAACANGQILQTVGGVQTCVTVSSDVTLASGGAATLASVASAGTTGDSTHVSQITIDAKGRVTTATPVAISSLGPACSNHQAVLSDGANGFACGPVPGASGNEMTSNGTTWVSTAPPVIPTLPTLTNHDIVVGQGTTTPAFLAPGPSGNLAVSNGTDWISGGLPLLPSQGATGVSSPTANGVPYANGSSPFTFLVGTDGTVLTGHTGAAPTWAAPTQFGSVTRTCAGSGGNSGTGGIIQLCNTPITLPASNLMITYVIGYDLQILGGLQADFTVGVQIDSNGSFAVSQVVTVPPNLGDPNTCTSPACGSGHTAATLVGEFGPLASGVHTVYSMWQANPIGVGVFSAGTTTAREMIQIAQQ